jgi:hypothetical protein
MKDTALVLVAILAGTIACEGQTMLHDPPLNPEHIDRLPANVRRSVRAMCATVPAAGHYFATYGPNRVTLHFEHFHCGEASNTFCKGSQCLHQIYTLKDGHYFLTKSGYGPEND